MAGEIAPRDQSWRVQYLRSVSATEWAQRYKARSFELIEARPGLKVIDIGCGLGDEVRALATIVGPHGQVVGVDHDPTMLERARAETPPNAVFREADVRSLPFPDAAFDAARIDRVLQHTGDAERVVAEMARVLRPGGRAVAIEPDWGTYAVDLPDPLLARGVLNARTDAYGDGWAGRKLYRLFHAAGLGEVAVEPFHAVMTDFEQARRTIDLGQAQQFGLRSNTLAAVDAQRWVDLVRKAEEAPTFFAVITLIMVAGTRLAPH